MQKYRWILALALSWMWAGQSCAEDVSLKLDNGLTVQGSLDLSEGKDLQNDGVVLFVHGTLAHKDMAIVTAQRKLLNQRGINVLAINLSLGVDKRTGMYDCAVPHTHKHRDAIKEIGAWMNWLFGQGVTSVVLAGHSRGGNQAAWYMAQENNPLIKKVVLIAPQTWTAQKEINSYKARYGKDLAPILAQMEEKVISGNGADLNKGIDFIYCPNATLSADSFVDYYEPDEQFNTPSLLYKIKVPTLVVVGGQDKVVSDLPKQMKKVSLDTVSFHVIEDAGHMFIDFAGEDLADQIADFLTGE